MFRRSLLWTAAAVLCLICVPAGAAEVDCDSVYCFRQEDFSQEAAVTGICLTDLPDRTLGCLTLGSRVLAEGDVLTADQAAQMTFQPRMTEIDRSAQVGYLPVHETGLGSQAVVTIGIRGKEDKAPVAEDSSLETYRNLANTGSLNAKDPEGQPLTYTLVRSPRRGTVTIAGDGTFTYTPKKNKVGVDSFTYTAADPAGNVSRETRVTVTILKPTDAPQYTDTQGQSCAFAAEWMKHTGIFLGETVAENPCFGPQEPVTRGQFVTMLVKALEIPVDQGLTYTGYTDSQPQWLQPYVAAAMRSGLTAGLPEPETFRSEAVITGSEAAVMLDNALDLTAGGEEADPVTALALQGIALSAEDPVTRGQAAQALYTACQLFEQKNTLTLEEE